MELDPDDEVLGFVSAVFTDNEGTENDFLSITYTPDPGIVSADARGRIESMLTMGDNFPVKRVTTYRFDSQVTDCTSFLKFRYCQYRQRYEITVNGVVVDSQESLQLKRDDGELVGVCLDKLLELILRGVPIPNPVGLLSESAASSPLAPTNTALAAAIAALVRQPVVGDRLGPGGRIPDNADRAEFEPGPLSSTLSGVADLIEAAADLEALGTRRSGAAATVLRDLAASRLREWR
jgi:hypothetical protein